jgi:formamidopyrimidine-DNA glycosylase
MPEGPEVRIIARQLNRLLAGAVFRGITILGGPYLSNEGPRYSETRRDLANLQPSTITWVKSKGKLIYMKLESGYFIANHLGMTGHWYLERSRHALLDLEYVVADGEGESVRHIYFDDFRHMGRLWVYNLSQMQAALHELGPDIFGDLMTEDYVYEYCQWSRKKIGALLMDQEFVSGIGNYLRADILYAARIDPRRPAASLTRDEAHELYQAIREISRNSLRARGTTIKTYRDVKMRRGDYSPIVYGRTTDEKGRPVEKFQLGGRTMHWVPAVQK